MHQNFEIEHRRDRSSKMLANLDWVLSAERHRPPDLRPATIPENDRH
ncbi:hypothetical protein [Chamaesiphon sp. GL140_3_metabinner_50]|nr:hypothetical protein [Chamaesiphon sp. GL140_3_metabinner_50]